MLTLIVESSGSRQNFVFTGDLVTIGRHEDSDLRISSRFVSQHHCKLQKLAKGWKLVDLSSQNGTRVNGVEITQKMLKMGDRLEVGHVPIYINEAPDEHTEPLMAGAEDETPALTETAVITARSDGGPRSVLHEELSTLFLKYRKSFGDDRGLVEIERAVEAVSEKYFPRPAFAMPVDAQKMMDITRAINSELNLKRCLTLIIDSMIDLTEAERGFLILNDEKGKMKVKVARNFDKESVTKADYKFSHSIAEEVGLKGKAIISSSAQEDNRFDSFQSVETLNLKSILCIPFRLRDRIIGVMYLDHRFRVGSFTDRELDMIESFADPAAIAIENARLYEENKETQDELSRRRDEIDELNSILNEKIKAKEIEISQFRSHAPVKAEFKYDYSFIVGDSPRMMEVFQLLERVIPSDVPVLISGETGTGKELIALAIHKNSDRSGNSFVKENCAAIPETLLESELFGYKKGAFTGADKDKVGLFKQADRGTLFLDEIGETSSDMQKKLLRVLQESEIRPVGAQKSISINVRFLSASNRNLRDEIKKGEFREDLFYRLNVISIEMPPLRERLEDVPLLVDFFLGKIAEQAGQPQKKVDARAMKHLIGYHWPGNVRELENEVRRACALGGAAIGVDDFSPDIRAVQPVASKNSGSESHWKDIVKMTAHQKEREMILKALEESDWKKSAAARALEISRPTLDNKIKNYGLAAYIRRGKSNRS